MTPDADPAGPPLDCDGITVRFGGFTALDSVSLAFPRGRTTALIGPNGAGKTTLLNVLSGRQMPGAGKVRMAGRDVTALGAAPRARLGLARSFQIISIFPDFTVFENLRLAAQRHCFRRMPAWRDAAGYRRPRQLAEAMLERIGLAGRGADRAGTLSHGEQRAIEIGLALVGDPAVLLLDEPLAGVGSREVAPFMELLDGICRVRTVVLIEHNMDAVMGLADRVAVLVGGRLLAQGTPAQIRADAEVRAAYLGTGA
ncbi:MAG: ABC transporter ATP-binding protein [Sneathiellaceae bacterium]